MSKDGRRATASRLALLRSLKLFLDFGCGHPHVAATMGSYQTFQRIRPLVRPSLRGTPMPQLKCTVCRCTIEFPEETARDFRSECPKTGGGQPPPVWRYCAP